MLIHQRVHGFMEFLFTLSTCVCRGQLGCGIHGGFALWPTFSATKISAISHSKKLASLNINENWILLNPTVYDHGHLGSTPFSYMLLASSIGSHIETHLKLNWRPRFAANPKSAAALSGASAANSCPFPTSRWPQTLAMHARPAAERRQDRGGGAKWALGWDHMGWREGIYIYIHIYIYICYIYVYIIYIYNNNS